MSYISISRFRPHPVSKQSACYTVKINISILFQDSEVVGLLAFWKPTVCGTRSTARSPQACHSDEDGSACCRSTTAMNGRFFTRSSGVFFPVERQREGRERSEVGRRAIIVTVQSGNFRFKIICNEVISIVVITILPYLCRWIRHLVREKDEEGIGAAGCTHTMLAIVPSYCQVEIRSSRGGGRRAGVSINQISTDYCGVSYSPMRTFERAAEPILFFIISSH